MTNAIEPADGLVCETPPPNRWPRRTLSFYAVVIALLAVGLVASIAFGATRMDWHIVLRVLGMHLLPEGLVDRTGVGRADDLIVWSVRAPRAFLAAIVGAALSVAGAQMQAIFRNPLAEPGLVGVGAGSALGGVIAFATGVGAIAAPLLPVFAFGGGLAALILVYGIATRGGRTSPMTLLLTGIAVAAILGSISSFVISVNLANQQILQQILFWTMGGLDSRTWLHVNLCLPFVGAGLLLAICFSRDLDLLTQGEETAMALGVNVERVKWTILACGAMLTGASVAVAGMIGFVGLIVPHVVRLILGPAHAVLIPASALTGSLFLVICDLASRTATAPAEVPLGVITALCGGPFFLFLLQRQMENGP
jgi:iron complex transport system permease protein